MEEAIAYLSNQQIQNFFQKCAPLTQADCDMEAERITKEPGGQAAEVQGATSYTHVTKSFAVQFRTDDNKLDLDLLRQVEKTYRGFVPSYDLSTVLDGKVYVYKMSKVPGKSMYLARDALYANNCQLLQQTLLDFARFFALAWHNRPPRGKPGRDTARDAHLIEGYINKLTELKKGLPARFHETLDHVTEGVPTLFEDHWPWVPNHTDLLENNIHVDLWTGRLLGICDWRDAEISPFGMSLHGLETMLGTHGPDVWHPHANHRALRELFWRSFYAEMGDLDENDKRHIDIARLVGVFLEYGLERDQDGQVVPVHTVLYLSLLDAAVQGPPVQ